jgi:hypothetical protein
VVVGLKVDSWLSKRPQNHLIENEVSILHSSLNSHTASNDYILKYEKQKQLSPTLILDYKINKFMSTQTFLLQNGTIRYSKKLTNLY